MYWKDILGMLNWLRSTGPHTACIHCILGTHMPVFRHVHHYGSDSQNHVVVTYGGNQIFGLLYVSETKGVYTKTGLLLPGGPLKC